MSTRCNPSIRAILVASLLLLAAVTGPALAAGAPIDEHAADAIDDRDERETVFDDPDELERLVDDAIAEQRTEHDVPGATVAVVEGDETVLAKGYGEADVETGTPVRANETAFMVGSVGKLVTWTAVMQGVEDGTLDLDEDVNTYLEDSAVEVPETYDEPVTLRHLGTHTAGFDTAINPGVVEDPDDVGSLERALVENRPERIRQPGERVSYSNYGAMLAGHVVAEAHDTTFEEYVRAEVFGPLGMDHSTFAQPVPDDRPGDLAAPHAPTTDGVERADRAYIDWRPAGSMSAIGPDMARFMRAHLGDGAVADARVLEPETVEAMHDVHHERHPAVNDLRYGFYEYGPAEADLIAHSGGTLHETSLLVLAPEDDVGIFVAYNVRNEGARPHDVVDEILEAYDLQPEVEAPVHADGDGARARAETVAGEYRDSRAPATGPTQVAGLLMRFSLEATDDGRLVSDALGAPEREWVETEPYVYREVDGHDVLAADVENGDVAALHRSSVPVVTYAPVPVHERATVVGGAVAVALIGFALSLLGWAGRAAWRRRSRRRERRDDGSESRVPDSNAGSAVTSLVDRLESRLRQPAWLARAAGVGLCIVSLGVTGLFLVGLGRHGELAFVTMPLALRASFALAPLAAVLALATAVGCVLAWSEGHWSRRARLHQTLLAVLGLAFAWQLIRLGFVGI